MTAGLAPSVPEMRLRFGVLPERDLARLHAASLALLGNAAGEAERAVSLAPRAISLGGRDADLHVAVDGRRPLLAAGGAAALLLPDGVAQPRPAGAADLVDACRLADALPEVACVVGPPLRVAGLGPLEELLQCLEVTRKHLQITTLRTASEAEAAVRMAVAVAGTGRPADRPPLSLCVPSDGLAAALVFARAGLPVGVTLPVADEMDGGTAVALVRHHAAVLAACRVVQQAAPGAPFVYLVPAGHELAIDGRPEDAILFALAALQLAAHVGLPARVHALATAAGEPGWQAGADNALGVLGALTSGVPVVAGAGTLSGGRVFSAQQLAIDAELFSWNARIAEGIAVDDETLALEVIKEVGTGGNYLAHRHTRRHMRGVWRPRLLDRSPWDAWVAAGRPESPELARALVEHLLGSHEVAPLDAVVSDTLAGIVAEASESV